MTELRPLIVVTGTVRIDGGETNSVRKQEESERRTSDGKKAVIVHEVAKTDDRAAAEVISTGYARRMQRLRILKTPFGALVDAANLEKVKEMIQRANNDVTTFNKSHKRCQLSNCLLWEKLAGNRLDAVRGYIDKQLAAGNAEVRDVLPLLRQSAAA